MGIMNVVWPVSALYFSFIALWAYYRFGRRNIRDAVAQDATHQRHAGHNASGANPSAAQVAVGTSHCGAGCMLADLVCEFAIAAPVSPSSGRCSGRSTPLTWALGIVFQYFAIVPMRHLSPAEGILAAMKADTLSIRAFQAGMYAWMAVTFFVLFPHPHLTAFDPRYWLMMQVAMICGFATSYPVNRWLIRAGVKEAM